MYARLVLLFLSFTNLVLASGYVRGTVIDSYLGEPVIYAEVKILDLNLITLTDLDGRYSFELSPGTYTISVEYLGYAKKAINGVQIEDGSVELVDIWLDEENEVIEEVVVTAEQNKNNETALLTIQRKSPVVLDGVSAQTISRNGDSDAGQAMQRIPGVSVENGKYIYVRGLGDRYTKTTLNGMDIPGLDPDRNTIQMDIFPTALVDNIIVRKTFSPDMPGDFSGGVVDITTKSFPDKEQFDVSLGLEYNVGTTFNNDFLTYKGGKLDWLGIDDGTRALPSGYDYESGPYPDFINVVTDDPAIVDFTRQFNTTLNSYKSPAFLNTSFNTSYGNQYSLGKNTIGFVTGFSYQNNNQHFENANYGEYFRSRNLQVNTLDDEQFRTSQGALSQNNVLWSGLMGLALKGRTFKITTQLFHTQNGEKSASSRFEKDGFDDQESQFTALTYSQRSITNLLLTSKFNINNLDLEFKNSTTLSKIIDPDLRVTQLEVSNGALPALSGGGGSSSDRLWRNLNELNESLNFDITYSFSKRNKIKFGLGNTFKTRTFVTTRADHVYEGIIPNGDPNHILSDSVIWDGTGNITDSTTYISALQEPQNTYNGVINIFSSYLMNELPINNKIRLIYGVRLEKAINRYTGRKQQVFYPTDSLHNAQLLNELDILPSVNLVYEVIKNTNIRASYSRTVARPSFKEISLAQVFDPITETTFMGNINLKQTNIDNIDLRWESFFNNNQMVSVSGFYKRFKNPIELTIQDEVAPREITPNNVDNAFLVGVEFEFKKNFNFIHRSLDKVFLIANTSFIKSRTQYTEEQYQALLNNARPNEVVSKNRVMFGQSPFLINTSLGYDNNGTSIILSYNIQGKRLVGLGIGRVPNIYEQPFHDLKFKISQNFGSEDQFNLSFSASNLIDDDRLRLYEIYNGESGTFAQTRAGKGFSLGFSYSFN